jgi:hypothetical protein
MAKGKKSTGNARKSPNIKPFKRAPKAGAKRNSAIPATAPRRAASSGAAVAQRRAQQQLQRPQAHASVQAQQPQRLPRVSGEITQDMIARRAYEIYCSGTGGSDFDNWCRAERELRGA